MARGNISILPSLLAADFGHLADEIRRAADSGAEALHLDIMDAHFVPNLSFGPEVVALAKRVTPEFHRNVHLMMTRPDLYLEAFAAAGADSLQIHVEADCDLHRELARIRALGMKNAIVLNPETPVTALWPYLGEIDAVLVMTVHPGYGGQKFIPEGLEKVAALRARLPDWVDIMVDGGVNDATAPMAAAAGANQLVAGSYLFRAPEMASAVAAMRADALRVSKAPYILDRLENLGKYAAISPNFASAVNFLQTADLAALSAGRQEISGSRVFADVHPALELVPCGQRPVELHQRYFDIQLPLSGPEWYGLAEFDSAVPGEFDAARDIGFYTQAVEYFRLQPGEFAIFRPGICAHAPGCTDGAPQALRKLIVKVEA